MRVVINTTTLNKGGALQVAYSVVNELSLLNLEYSFLILCSVPFYNQIESAKLPNNFSIEIVKKTPAKLITRNRVIKILNKAVEEFKADIVLTIFGPSYWKPKVSHVCGFADGWCYYPETIAYKKLKPFNQLKRKLLSKYKLFYLKRDSDHIFIETEDAKKRLIKILNLKQEEVTVISNTYSSIYDQVRLFGKRHQLLLDERKHVDEIRFLLLSANYPHKNIQIINEVIELLKTEIEHFKFFLTIPEDDYNKIIKNLNKKYVVNLGPVKVEQCIQLYQNTDFLFLPTLLETFTATYPEAMVMKKPILTSDLSFARDICRDAACYFDPLDSKDIVKKIKKVINNPEIKKRMIDNGIVRVKDFPTSKNRAINLLELCLNINDKK